MYLKRLSHIVDNLTGFFSSYNSLSIFAGEHFFTKSVTFWPKKMCFFSSWRLYVVSHSPRRFDVRKIFRYVCVVLMVQQLSISKSSTVCLLQRALMSKVIKEPNNGVKEHGCKNEAEYDEHQLQQQRQQEHKQQHQSKRIKWKEWGEWREKKSRCEDIEPLSKTVNEVPTLQPFIQLSCAILLLVLPYFFIFFLLLRFFSLAPTFLLE